jgi:outer membrane efflux protein
VPKAQQSPYAPIRSDSNKVWVGSSLSADEALDANFNAIRQHRSIGGPPEPTEAAPTFNLFTGQLNVSYLPDVFGGTRRSIKALAAQADSQRFQLEATYLTLTSNLAGAAVQEASLRGQIAATLRIIKIETDVLALLRRQHELGQVAEADVVAQEAAAGGTAPTRNRSVRSRSGRLPINGGPHRFIAELCSAATCCPRRPWAGATAQVLTVS